MSEHLLNLYEIQNLSDLRCEYRLVDIRGLVTTDAETVDRSLSLLAKLVAIAERAPATVVRRNHDALLAIPADLELRQTQYQLTPDLINLAPREETYQAQFPASTPEQRRVGSAFLQFDLRAPLRRDRSLWSTSSNTYLMKKARNTREAGRDVDIYDGFSFRLRELDQRLFIVISPASKWVENGWLVDRYTPAQLTGLKMRRALYHFGHSWYVVQIVDAPARSIREAEFTHRTTGATHNVYDYTLAEVGRGAPPWVATLDPESPMIVYQYPGRDARMYGAAALAKLMLGNNDPRSRAAQRAATRSPEERFCFTHEVAERFFQGVSFRGTRLGVSSHALARNLQTFSFPTLEFGQGRQLVVGHNRDHGEIAPKDLGQTRLELLSDPEAGFAVSGAFDRQFLLVPASLRREIAENFQVRLEATVRQFCQSPYRLDSILFDDRRARTLKEQVDAVVGAVEQNRASGHGVLVLPAGAHEDLHNFVKRKLAATVQVQCVSAHKLHEFYIDALVSGRQTVRVKSAEESRYRSYLTNTALGLMIVNRHWGWVLADSTHYEAYVSLDVLNHMACFVFVVAGGRQCVVRYVPTQQKEKLNRAQIRAVVSEMLRKMLTAAQPLRSIVLQRDGQLFTREWEGFVDAVTELKRGGLMQADALAGAVEIAKRTAEDLRIAAPFKHTLENPRMGVALKLDPSEGIICTTGWPFRLRGTARPLHVRIARGSLDIDHVLEDTFCLSQLAWAAPNKPMRLPIGIKLGDDFLRSVAGEADEDSALYGEDSSGSAAV
jgi:hypothetical protein